MSVILDLDDLGSFDGSEPGMVRTPNTPGSPVQPWNANSPIGLTIDQVLPSRIDGSINGDNSYGHHPAHSAHGVHMHTHENTKVPLLNHAVDRTNSSRPTYRGLAEGPSAGGGGRVGFSMAELFLNKESSHRQSLNRNYEGLGALIDDVGSGTASRRASGDGTVTSDRGDAFAVLKDIETQMEIDALTAAIDPTPWSEMEQRIYDPEGIHPHMSSYYPYGRQHQLPIPYRPPPSPPTDSTSTMIHPVIPAQDQEESTSIDTSTLQEALATAARLASVGASDDPVGTVPEKVSPAITTPSIPSSGHSSYSPSSSNALNKAEAPFQAAPSQTNSQNKTVKPSVAPAVQPYQLKRAAYSPPQHASAHTTSRASVLAAANKKTQYGFGGNHVVPSVPAPPPTASTKAKEKTTVQSHIPIPPLASESAANHSGIAYERKKQRAKDARIKLNEAIERLSIAMNLSGTQSKQRIHLLKTRIRSTEQRTKSLYILDECTKLAEQAKKWDRPSFLSSAASIVQALNSQCESLARELVCLQERLDATAGSTGGLPGIIPSATVQLISERNQKRPESPSGLSCESPSKRIRTEELSEAVAGIPDRIIEFVELDEKALLCIAKMLDPASLIQCSCVSRKWRDIKIFDNCAVWFELAVKRFGFYNVRQWDEKLKDTETDAMDLSKKALYRAMSSANVMPHIQHPAGMVFLGDAKIPGRVGGWVYMVDRSNGETLRSVKRDPTHQPSSTHGVVGTYQSRPVVELRIVLQNIGMAKGPVVIHDQRFSVDVSTRRSGGELNEIHWDDRFSKAVKTLEGRAYQQRPQQGGSFPPRSNTDGHGKLCLLTLFEAAEITVHIDATGCSTSSKFRQKSNFTKVLVSLEGTTVPLVFPFAR